MIAEDWRDSEVLKKAIVAMSEITDEFVFHVGLVADYGALAVRLIRAFDVQDKDPATNRGLLRALTDQCRMLFHHGAILRSPSSVAGGVLPASSRETHQRAENREKSH